MDRGPRAISPARRALSLAGPALAAAAVLAAPAFHQPQRPDDPLAARASSAPSPDRSQDPPGDDDRLAGSHAGEGRTHPGRAAETGSGSPSAPGSGPDRPSSPGAAPPDDPEAGRAPGQDHPPMDRGGNTPGGGPGRTGGPGGPGGPGGTDEEATAARHRDDEALDDGDRVMRVLPLGTGMTLTGLGLGYFALRIRRAR